MEAYNDGEQYLATRLAKELYKNPTGKIGNFNVPLAALSQEEAKRADIIAALEAR